MKKSLIASVVASACGAMLLLASAANAASIPDVKLKTPAHLSALTAPIADRDDDGDDDDGRCHRRPRPRHCDDDDGDD